MQKLYYFFIIFSVSGLAACSTMPDKTGEQMVASVEDKHLYASDLAGLVSKGISATDSATIVTNYIETWARKQAMLVKAEKEVELDNQEIERKIADYRYDLMIYELEKKYLQQNLDTAVTDQQIQKYYEENPANFELKQNIVQGSLVRLPKGTPEVDKARRWMKQKDESSRTELKNYCYRYASTYVIGDSTWVDFESMISHTPFRELPNKTQFLKQNSYAENTDEESIYLLAIDDYKIASQTSPLSFVKNQVRDVILNQRKTALIHSFEQKVYKEAKEKNKIKVHQVSE
ncbi:peptidyl-prolyl cis-trans isomerase [Rhodocytophaga aerolata]|uniref:Peptidyl-prolyl cis-trans isomerase n=1 Tax=Rhodocytophaga aerolata TaxID=455078 RepID=A0ABT8R8Z9_9BACT|nr:peptidyl-prolyl cis-trans isomerase [Rhodocytophaga aerolata]MDO1448560.1 peptidyl-prolyl cis-trans isomerase [Rhodocytophaga aerolata]